MLPDRMSMRKDECTVLGLSVCLLNLTLPVTFDLVKYHCLFWFAYSYGQALSEHHHCLPSYDLDFDLVIWMTLLKKFCFTNILLTSALDTLINLQFQFIS